MHHTPTPTVRQHEGVLYQNSEGAPVKNCCAPEGLEHKIAHLPHCLLGIHLQHYWLDFS
jgi:hypothetical protein